MSTYSNYYKKQDEDSNSQGLNISYSNGARISHTSQQVQAAKSSMSAQPMSAQLMRDVVGINPDREIIGTSGRDYLYGGYYTNDFIYGRAGDDRLYGLGGDDFLAGGRGNDYLAGGAGADTCHWGVGGGNDVIYNYNYQDHRAGVEDTLIIGGIENADDITWSRSNSDLVASFEAPNGSQQSLTIKYWYAGEYYQVETIRLENGDIIDVGDIQFTKRGTEGNDYLYGSSSSEIIMGLGGNDFISAGAGDDRLIGGAGNDRLIGGAGNDTYVWGLGDGNDEIYDSNYVDRVNGAVDTLVFGEGIGAEDIAWSRSGYDLVATVNHGDEQQQLKLKYWYYSEAYQVEKITLANGREINVDNIEFEILGTDDNDSLHGSEGEETIKGLAGNDLLVGNGGDDRLVGGAGDDTLKGGTGNDTYVWGLGDGNDWIEDNDQQHYCVEDYHDVVQLGAGIGAEDIAWSRVGMHLVATVEDNGVSQSLTLGNWFYGERYQVEEVRLADRTSIDMDNISLAVHGTERADYLRGTDANESIYGLQGNDLMLAMGGNDDLFGGAGNDRMYFYGEGEHTAEGGDGADLFVLDTFFSGSTHVKDFNFLQNDDIDLSRILRNAQHNGEELIEDLDVSDTFMHVTFFNGAQLIVDASTGGMLDFVDEHLLLGA